MGLITATAADPTREPLPLNARTTVTKITRVEAPQ